jgi:thymidine kinase
MRVIVAGLDQDYLGKPFEPMPQLLAIAEYITKTHAICMVCGNPANHTQRLVASEDRVLLGAHGLYEARCRRCFDPLLTRTVSSTSAAGAAAAEGAKTPLPDSTWQTS